MLSGVNSHSNGAYIGAQNASKNQNSQDINSSKDANLNKANSTNSALNSTNSARNSANSVNLTQNSATNSSISSTENLVQKSAPVKDKSEAVSEILDYGVDSEGYFTSEFNEAVGLTSDYKIYAKGIENLANELASNKNFSQTNIVQSLANAYKIFSQLGLNEQSYDKEQISQMPLGFDFDKKSLKITQLYYTQNELSNTISSSDNAFYPTQSASTFGELAASDLQKIEDIFDKNSLNLGKNAYINNGEVNKSGLFVAVAGALLTQGANGYIIDGKTTISGKLLGFDKDLSKDGLKDLRDFVSDNAYLNTSSTSTGEAFGKMMKILDLFNADLSVDEFKAQWLGILDGSVEINEQELKSFESIIANFINANGSSQNATQSTLQEGENSTKRTPIEVKSKSETYKNLGFAKYKNLLQDEQKLNMFEILFKKSSQKSKFNSALNGLNLANFSSDDLNINFMNLSQIKSLSKIDIKA